MKFIKLLSFVLVFVLLYGCVCPLINPNNDQPQPDDEPDEPYDPVEPDDPGVNGDNGDDQDDEELQIPPGTIALFYVGSASSSYYSYGQEIESSVKAIIMFFPEINGGSILKHYTSYSYSENAVYPYTAGGKIFVVRDWGSDWSADNRRWDIDEMDPNTGQTKSTTMIYATQFAIVDDAIYYTDDGILKSVSLGGSHTYANELQPASGTIYAVGDHLVSLAYDYSGEYVTYSIREHDLQTGAITKVLYSDIPTTPVQDGIYPGEKAMYMVQWDGNMRYIYRYPIVGEPEVFEFELYEGENDVFIAEDDGVLAIVIQSTSGLKISSMLIHNLNTGQEEFLEFDSFNTLASFRRIGFPFLVLE